MIITHITLQNYRNIANMDISPDPNVNVIYGDNAQGKTNIIESIWLFTGNQSFRGSKYNELIEFDKNAALVSLDFRDEKREQKATIELNIEQQIIKKKATLNNVPQKRISELNGNFYAVVFSPVHLSLVNDGPKGRRRFLDIAISQLKPQYKEYMASYEKVLAQRNALLKSRPANIEQQLDVWDIQLAKVGTLLTCYRKDYVKRLRPVCKHYYSGISLDNEDFNLCYSSTIFEQCEVLYDEVSIEQYHQKLKECINIDIKQGYTTCGIHRDELILSINGISVRDYGSQGQQRSAVITLKLGEAALMRKVTGENPIMLLDDVMSELDESRQDYILNHLVDMQVFITCCDRDSIKKLKDGKGFKISKGEIV